MLKPVVPGCFRKMTGIFFFFFLQVIVSLHLQREPLGAECHRRIQKLLRYRQTHRWFWSFHEIWRESDIFQHYSWILLKWRFTLIKIKHISHISITIVVSQHVDSLCPSMIFLSPLQYHEDEWNLYLWF